MSLSELGVMALLAGLILAGVVAVFFWREGRGIFRLWRSIDARKIKFEHRKHENISSKERQAIEVVLETCSRYQREKLFYGEGLRFLPDTLHLISQVAASLAVLELKGRARQVGGMHYVLARETRAQYWVE